MSIAKARAILSDIRGVSVSEYAVLGAGIVIGLALVTPTFANAVGTLIHATNAALASLM